jgi:YggT family protein
MIILVYLVEAVATLLGTLLQLYMWIMVARAVISWVNPDPHNPIVRFLYSATEPVLYRVRRMLPLYAGGVDFSPIAVFVAIYVLQAVLVRYLYYLAQSLRDMG